MTGMPAIAVYAIMRNEEPHVERWARSVQHADYVVVLDTGSSDGTIEALVDLDIEVHCAAFRPFRFDDALNAALALVPEDIDVVMRLDADETITDGWHTAIGEAYDPRICRYRTHVVNHGPGWGEMWRSYIHARHGLRWRYPTHELLVGPTAFVDIDATVHHWPIEGPKPHYGTDLQTLTDAVAEYPGDERMAFYFARQLFYAGRYPECRAEMMRFLSFATWEPDRCEAFRILAAIDDDPERWLWKAVGELPARREPWCDLTRLYIAQGDLSAAGSTYRLAARRIDRTLYWTQPDCWDEAFEALAADAGLRAGGI
jgi:glycosyltransferase involved in cell wall biosynthesis